MALDRRISIRRTVSGGTDVFGRPLPDTVETLATVWAERRSAGTADTLTAGGVVVTNSVAWTIRYRRDVLEADIATLSIVDEDDDTWNPETIVESDARAPVHINLRHPGGGMTAVVSIRGGRKLRRFLLDVEDALQEAALFAMRDVIRREVLPSLKRVLPVRTGKLRREVRVEVRSGHVEVRGPFYGRFQRIGPQRDTIAEHIVDLIEENRERLRALVRAELRRRLPV